MKDELKAMSKSTYALENVVSELQKNGDDKVDVCEWFKWQSSQNGDDEEDVQEWTRERNSTFLKAS